MIVMINEIPRSSENILIIFTLLVSLKFMDYAHHEESLLHPFGRLSAGLSGF